MTSTEKSSRTLRLTSIPAVSDLSAACAVKDCELFESLALLRIGTFSVCAASTRFGILRITPTSIQFLVGCSFLSARCILDVARLRLATPRASILFPAQHAVARGL
jgi:hypothetical protein